MIYECIKQVSENAEGSAGTSGTQRFIHHPQQITRSSQKALQTYVWSTDCKKNTLKWEVRTSSVLESYSLAALVEADIRVSLRVAVAHRLPFTGHRRSTCGDTQEETWTHFQAWKLTDTFIIYFNITFYFSPAQPKLFILLLSLKAKGHCIPVDIIYMHVVSDNRLTMDFHTIRFLHCIATHSFGATHHPQCIVGFQECAYLQ